MKMHESQNVKRKIEYNCWKEEEMSERRKKILQNVKNKIYGFARAGGKMHREWDAMQKERDRENKEIH